MTFVSNALTNSMRRFFSYEMGKMDGNVSNVFTMNFKIQLVIIVVLVVLLETAGLWFFETVIKIPEGRETAASIVYQFSVVTFCLNLLQVPYSSLIVAREKMSIFAILSILDVVLKLMIVYLLSSSLETDRLVLYGFLMMAVTLIATLCYYIYCKVAIRTDCRVTNYWDKNQFKEIFSFASWNLVGGVTTVGTTEVPNYFMNYYLGVGVNAAMGVAKQISNAIYTFSSNFQTAFNPQITKSYASGDKDYLLELVFRTSKLSFFLLYIIALPFFLCSQEVLSVWLKVVPDYTASFCLFIVMAELIQALSSPLWMTIFAIGNIRKYQLWLCVINLTVIPVSWFILFNGFEPYWILAYKIVISLVILIYRIQYLNKKIDFPKTRYFSQIIIRLLVFIPLLTFPFLYWFSSLFDGWLKIIIVSMVSIVFVSVIFYLIGLDRNDRGAVKAIVLRRILNRS